MVNRKRLHHYETIEVRDQKGRLVLPKGQIVDSTFKVIVPYGATYSGIGAYENVSFTPGTSGEINPVIGVTNYEYESKRNEDKRQIYVLKVSYLQQFLNDMRVIMHYEKSSQYINTKLIRTENTRIVNP